MDVFTIWDRLVEAEPGADVAVLALGLGPLHQHGEGGGVGKGCWLGGRGTLKSKKLMVDALVRQFLVNAALTPISHPLT